MSRKARIDAPGALHHIIFRGIERRKIFRDNKDRDNFLDRLGNVLSDSKTPCYAWALIPNRRIEIYFFTYDPYSRCNVVICERQNKTVVSIIKPKVAMKMIGNVELKQIASTIEKKLKKVFDSII